MKISKLIYPILAFVIILSSCEGSDVDIDAMIKNKKNPIQYVIEGQITNIAKKQHVFISKPGAISGANDYESVSNAKVEVSDGKNRWIFKELPKDSPKYDDLYQPNTPKLVTGGVYESETYFAGKAGKTYTLKVTINGEVFTAQETMPIADKMTDEEFNILKNTGEFSHKIYGTKKDAIWNTDKSDTYYSFNTRENLKIVITGMINFFKRNYIGETDRNVSEKLIIGNEASILRRYTATKSYNNYIWSYVFGGESSVMSIEQNPHSSNFNNKKIAGYFSAINCSQYKVESKSYNEHLISYLSSNKSYSASYGDKGKFTLNLDDKGACELIGMHEKLTGAYDIINKKQIRVYFKRRIMGNVIDLKHFYEKTLKQAQIFDIPPKGTMQYRSAENAIFEIQPDGNIKAQDGTVWKIKTK